MKIALLKILDIFADIVSAFVFAILSSLFVAFKWLSDVVGSFRMHRGYETGYFDRPYDEESIYRMALEVPKRKGEKVTVRNVWDTFPLLSKRQAYRVLDRIKIMYENPLRS